jgi:hypothetical protein
MSHLNFRRGTAVLVLGLVLGTPLVSWAAPRPTGRHAGILEAGPAPLAWLWSFLARVWEKNGCRVDPNGRCLDGLQAPAKNGCSVDPNGRCAPGQ